MPTKWIWGKRSNAGEMDLAQLDDSALWSDSVFTVLLNQNYRAKKYGVSDL